MKKLLMIIMSIVTVVIATACSSNDKYVEENYNVDSDNVFKYITTKEFDKMIDNEETFFVFVGTPT